MKIAAIPVIMAANNKAVTRIKIVMMKIMMMMRTTMRMIMMITETREEEDLEITGEVMEISKAKGAT
jgi:hypothetical protein